MTHINDQTKNLKLKCDTWGSRWWHFGSTYPFRPRGSKIKNFNDSECGPINFIGVKIAPSVGTKSSVVVVVILVVVVNAVVVVVRFVVDWVVLIDVGLTDKIDGIIAVWFLMSLVIATLL